MNAAQKERPGILKRTPSGKTRVPIMGHSLRAQSTRDKVGVGDGGGLAREHGVGTHDYNIPPQGPVHHRFGHGCPVVHLGTNVVLLSQLWNRAA